MHYAANKENLPAQKCTARRDNRAVAAVDAQVQESWHQENERICAHGWPPLPVWPCFCSYTAFDG